MDATEFIILGAIIIAIVLLILNAYYKLQMWLRVRRNTMEMEKFDKELIDMGYDIKS